jgi:hypothetical protein
MAERERPVGMGGRNRIVTVPFFFKKEPFGQNNPEFSAMGMTGRFKS